MCQFNWIDVLSALLTPTIALLGSYIAWQQWRLSRRRLTLDLFEKRYAVYSATRDLIGTVVAHGRVTDREAYEFLLKTSDSEFVCGAQVAEYLKRLFEKVCALQALFSELEALPVGQGRSENVRRQREIKDFITSQHEQLRCLFQPLLTL
ncbi:MAG: hypothetical protein AB7F08_09750 [Dongiaceae bacterium]